jgi:hypothetical protein
MNVEVLDVIYGAFIVVLHATAKIGVMVFHWPLRFLFSYDYMEKVHSNHIKRDQDENEMRRAGWALDGTVSHHLRFNYVGRCEL